MGKGKRAVDHYVCEVQPGRIIFEVEGVSEELAHASWQLKNYQCCVNLLHATTTKDKLLRDYQMGNYQIIAFFNYQIDIKQWQRKNLHLLNWTTNN